MREKRHVKKTRTKKAGNQASASSKEDAEKEIAISEDDKEVMPRLGMGLYRPPIPL